MKDFKSDKNLLFFFLPLQFAFFVLYSFNSFFFFLFGDLAYRFIWFSSGLLAASVFIVLFGFQKEKLPLYSHLKAFFVIILILFGTNILLSGLEKFLQISFSWKASFNQIHWIKARFGIFGEWVFLFLFSLIVFTLFIQMSYSLIRNFYFYQFLLQKRFEKKDSESYQKWLLQEIDAHPRLIDPKAILNRFASRWIFMILIGFLAILRVPNASLFLSFLFLPVALSDFVVFLIFRQQHTLLDWILKGYQIPENSEREWDRFILLFLIPVILIPLLIPWNYRIFNLDELTQKLNQQLSGISLEIGENLSTDQNTQKTNTSVHTSYEQDRYPSKKHSKNSFLFVLKILFFMELSFIFLGTILKLLRLHRPYRHPIPRFLIFHFTLIQQILKAILNFILTSLRLIAAIFLPKYGKKEQLSEPVKEQLMQLFSVQEQISEEKKEEMNRVIAAFVKLIDATHRTLLPYRYFYGPLEYIQKIIEIKKEYRNLLLTVVSIFNESRYSLHLIEEQKLKDYESKIEKFIEKIP